MGKSRSSRPSESAKEEPKEPKTQEFGWLEVLIDRSENLVKLRAQASPSVVLVLTDDEIARLNERVNGSDEWRVME
ncbi:MAG: hypothetical protein WAN50_05465 [Minisyncoccia bacterium]